ncbi:UNVERIFIED_ORG: hypothetical protein FHW05_004771, partial [Pantoea agglomerans]
RLKEFWISEMAGQHCKKNSMLPVDALMQQNHSMTACSKIILSLRFRTVGLQPPQPADG